MEIERRKVIKNSRLCFGTGGSELEDYLVKFITF